jgi:hypothetical protein
MLKSLRNYNNVAAVNNTMEVMQGELYAPDLFEQLNTDVHIVNVRNGMLAAQDGGARHPQAAVLVHLHDRRRLQSECLRQRRMIQGWG